MKPLIRPITPSDEAEWRRLWTAYLEFYQTSAPDEVYRSSFDRLMLGNAGAENEFKGLLALVDGKPVGLVHYLFHRHGWKIENVCYLQDLYADPNFRKKGVGRALIEAVYARADEAGAPSVYWLTQDFNFEARRLYDRVGMLTPFVKYSRS